MASTGDLVLGDFHGPQLHRDGRLIRLVNDYYGRFPVNFEHEWKDNPQRLLPLLNHPKPPSRVRH